MFTSMQVYLGGPAKDEQFREFLPGLVQISKGWSSFISVNSETQGAHFLGWAFPYARVYTYIICTCICTCVHMYNLYMYMLYIYMYIYNINTYVCPCAYVFLGGNFLLRWFQSASQFVARALEVIRGRPSDGGMHLGMTLLRYWPVDPKERFVLEEGWHLHCH